MKIKKTILTAMVLGMAIGTTATSCEKLDLKKEQNEHIHNAECGDDCAEDMGNDYPEDCPACGMG